MISIEIEEGQTFPSELLERAAKAILDFCGIPDADLTLVLADDPKLRSLNRDFLNHDYPTDVLAFSAGEEDPDTGHNYLGDVVISFPRATLQATERGHSVEAEVQLLAIHGMLHLIGYDHAEKDEKERMWKAQAEILKNLGISTKIIHE
jgi:probable rRNA maturation factor